MHHIERILPLTHMQARQRAPSPADRVKRAPGEIVERLRLGQGLANDAHRLFGRALGDIHQRQAAQRQRDAAPHLALLDVDQFERTAAEVADDAVRLEDRAEHALRRQLRLALPIEQLDPAADRALGKLEKLRAVGGVAHGGGGDGGDVLDAHRAAKHLEALQRGQSLGDGIVGQESGSSLRLCQGRKAPFH